MRNTLFFLSLLVLFLAVASIPAPKAFGHEQISVYEKYRVTFNIAPDEPIVGKIGVFATFTYKVDRANTQQEVQILFIRINVTSPQGPVAQHLYQGNKAFHILTEGGLHRADAILTLADGTSIPTSFTISALEEGVSLGPIDTLLISLSVFAPVSLTKAVHIVAASIWVGTSFQTYMVARSAGNSKEREGNPRFRLEHGQAMFYATSFAVGIVISTGLFNAGYKHGIGLSTLDVLVTTAYGLVLLSKISMSVLVLLLGALIQFRYLPRVNRDKPEEGHKTWATLRKLLAAEILVFIFIIYLATIFTSLHPTS